MTSFPEYMEPFSIVYSQVTEDVRTEIRSLPAKHLGVWLTQITDGFWHEFNGWPQNVAMTPYLNAVQRLDSKLMRLGACAFLHVCFDLPRVIADNWPTTPSDLKIVRQQYFSLSHIFRSVFARVASDGRVTGHWPSWGGWILGKADEDILAVTATWVLHLRTAAWIHAEVLANAGPHRVQLERNLLYAVERAMQHANGLMKMGRIDPPHDVLLSAPVLALTVTIDPWLLAALVSAIGAGFAIWVWRNQRAQQERIAQLERRIENLPQPEVQKTAFFIAELGMRVLEYTAFAVDRPEEMERLVERRRPRGIEVEG